MTLARASSQNVFPGQSLKTMRPAWCAARQDLIVQAINGFSQVSCTVANSKGAWGQIFASAAVDSILYICPVATQSATDAAVLIDIGVGASGAETAVISDLAIGGMPFSALFAAMVPVLIPAGSRVAVRAQAATVTQSVQAPYCALVACRDGHLLPRSVDTLGSFVSTSRGTALAGASGSYTQIVASTSRPYQSLILVPSSGNKSGIGADVRLTLAIGSPESDVATYDCRQVAGGALAATTLGIASPLVTAGVHVPAGSSIHVKHNIAANPDRLQVSVIGVPYR